MVVVSAAAEILNHGDIVTESVLGASHNAACDDV